MKRFARLTVAILAGSLLLAASASQALCGDGTVRIDSVTVSGSEVLLVVRNNSEMARTGTVVFEVLVDGRRVVGTVPFSVPADRRSSLVVRSPLSGGLILDAGIIFDDGAPI